MEYYSHPEAYVDDMENMVSTVSQQYEKSDETNFCGCTPLL